MPPARKAAPRQQGDWAEARAAAHLAQAGLTLLCRNYRCRLGEIDLVMQDGADLVFVEVRCRSDRGYGGAAGSVTGRKIARLVNTARHYLMTHPEANLRRCRFDVIAISGAPARPELEWIRDAFQA
jgi:putative endonuclease